MKNIFLLIAIISLLFSCKTPLEIVVKDKANGYLVKKPVSGMNDIGKYITNRGTIFPNQCFEGKGDTMDVSWNKAVVNYDKNTSVNLNADFGNVINGKGDIGKNDSYRIVLSDVKRSTISGLYFIPNAGCVFNDSEVLNYDVITEALKAGQIEITGDTYLRKKLEINIPKVGGFISDSTNTKGIWKGSSLYFAHNIESIEVHRSSSQKNMSISNDRLTIGGCSFILNSVESKGWTGTLSCESINEDNNFPLRGSNNSFDNQIFKGGISYSLNVSLSGVGTANVEMNQYRVLPK